MTVASVSELMVKGEVLWSDEEMTAIERITMFIPMNRSLKFQTWLKKRNLDWIDHTRAYFVPGYRTFYITGNSQSDMDSALIRLKECGACIRSEFLDDSLEDYGQE